MDETKAMQAVQDGLAIAEATGKGFKEDEAPARAVVLGLQARCPAATPTPLHLAALLKQFETQERG
jgi:hypothetical protein